MRNYTDPYKTPKTNREVALKAFNRVALLACAGLATTLIACYAFLQGHNVLGGGALAVSLLGFSGLGRQLFSARKSHWWYDRYSYRDTTIT